MSLFVVVPYLSADKTTYGIYSVCISITVFLSYVDFGFLGAGIKYAAESFSRDDRREEMRFIGFSLFILLIFLLILSSVFLYLSFNPEILIKGIESGEQSNIAHNLLLILAISSPTIILQRVLQIIFSIRLEDYILQRINIFGNLIKIISVFYFFSFGRYDIIGYYIFMQAVNFFCAIMAVLKAKQIYNYDFGSLMRQIRFNSKIFNKTKGLAFSGFFITISWITYYELDSFSIGKLMGANNVAIYAIGFAILTFFRSLLGAFFSPFSARFNHFIGSRKEQELKQFYLHVVTITFPVVVFPIIAVVLFARPLVISWVGIEYGKSVEIVRWLVLCNIFAFISYPAGMLMVALEKLKMMYVLAILMPIIYWIGIIFTIKTCGLVSFAFFKFLIFGLSGTLYLWFSLRFLNITFTEFIKKNIILYLPGLIVMSLMLFFMKEIFVDDKNKLNLFNNVLIIGLGIMIAMGISLFTVLSLRVYLNKINKIIKKRESKSI